MKKSPPFRPAPGPSRAPFHRGSRLLLAALLLSVAAIALAATDGQCEVRSASTTRCNGMWCVNGRVDYRLGTKAEEALRNGVALTIRLEVELQRVRSYWSNPVIVDVREEYQVSYQPVTEFYVVREVNTGEQASYSSLFAALNALGRVENLALVEDAQLNPEDDYVVRVRALLDRQTLPRPLRLLSWWTGGFSLESDWYEWSLDR